MSGRVPQAVTVESLKADLQFARSVSRRQRSKVRDLRSVLVMLERRLDAGDMDGVVWVVQNWRDIVHGLAAGKASHEDG